MLVLVGLFGGTLIALVFMGTKPRWLEPQWMSWLRDHYDWSVVDFMLSRARYDRGWHDRVATQEGLEGWAKEMAEKYRTGDSGLGWRSK